MKNAASRLSPKTTFVFLITIVVLVSFGVYFNALFNGFVYDDKTQVLNNQWITDVQFLPDIFTSSAWGFAGKNVVSDYYRPMLHLIYMLNFHIFGLNPWGFHLVNIIFHAGVSVLVFFITRRLLSWHEQSTQANAEHLTLLPAFAASLLFAVHPIHTEAVTWVAGLCDLSYTFFCLFSFYFYISSEDESRGLYWLSVLSFFIATLCKEPALMMPFILMAYDYIFRRISPAAFLKRYIPFFVVSVAYLAIRHNVLGGFSPQESHTKLSTYGYIINVFPLFSKYLEKLLLPLNLNTFHVMHPVSSIFELHWVISLIVTVIFVGLIFAVFTKKDNVFFKTLSFCLLLITFPLLPSLYIPAVGENAFAERYLYLPSFGFVLLIGAAIKGAMPARPVLKAGLAASCIALTVLFSIGVITRNAVWRDDYSLWSDTIITSPDAATPYNNLAEALIKKGELGRALEYLQTGLKHNPFSPDIYINLCSIYFNFGQLDNAIDYCKAALKFNPDDAEGYYNLGTAYGKKRMFNEAIQALQTSVILNPRNTDAYNNLGIVYQQQGRREEAISAYRSALQHDPMQEQATRNLGALLSAP